MRFARRSTLLAVLLCCTAALAGAQTADELIAKNLEARGGMAKIKAINTLRQTGRVTQGSFTAQVAQENKRPGMIRQTFTVQGMTEIDAYDGKTPWRISPFEGRRDPEIMGEDAARTIIEDSDFDGPLVDYQKKGNKVENIGPGTLDGDSVLRLKVTLKNGDVVTYYLDPDTFLEIRVERMQFIRGTMHETVTDLGSYKPAGGVMYPTSISSGPPDNPQQRSRVTIDKIEVNVPIPDTDFEMPTTSHSGPQPPPTPHN